MSSEDLQNQREQARMQSQPAHAIPAFRRPNQAQRKQQVLASKAEADLQPSAPTYSSIQAPQTTINQTSHIRVLQRPPREHPSAQPAVLQSKEPWSRTPATRAPFQNASLGNRSNVLQVRNAPPFQAPRTSAQDQVDYLDRLAFRKIEEVQISQGEHEEKETLRLLMEAVCRDAIYEFEKEANPQFDPSGVQLKCFGSLNIGFATRDSDMDVVLLSPASSPELSSPESKIPRLIEKAFMERKFGVRLLTQTRVPIIKFCERPTDLLAGWLRRTRLLWEAGYSEMKTSPPVEEASKASKAEDPGSSQQGIQEATTEKASDIASVTSENPSSQQESPGPEVSEEVKLSNLGNDVDNGDDLAKAKPPDEPEIAASHDNTKDHLQESQDPTQKDKTHKEKRPNTPRKPEGVGTSDDSFNCLSKYTGQELSGLCHHLTGLKSFNGEEKQIMSSFSLVYETKKYPHQASEVSKARSALETLPDLLTRCPVPSREDLDYPKTGVGIQCDINFSNDLALHNSLLLKCYSLCDPRVRIVVLFVKAWTKRRKINSPYHGTLNSYGYVLMVLHYLMNVVQPPVLPNLQLMRKMIADDPLSSSQTTFKGHNVQFFRNEGRLQEMARQGQITRNRESVGSLLRGFFQYYANPPINGFRFKNDVLSLRTPGGILTKQSKGWVGARSEVVKMTGPVPSEKKINHHYVIAIEDPFEIEHNVARTVFFHGIVAIRDEFRRAVSLIVHVGRDPHLGPQDFFAEGNSNENLQSRGGRPGQQQARTPKKSVDGAGKGPSGKATSAQDQVKDSLLRMDMSIAPPGAVNSLSPQGSQG